METFKINYKSDFVLRLASDAGWGTAFTLEFWTKGAPTKRYYATHDGNGNYTNCKPDSDTELRVMFDDHGLGIGNLMLRITYSLADEEFRTGKDDEVVNVAAITVLNDEGEEVNVMLNLEGETAAEIQYSLPMLANEAERQENEKARQAAEAARAEAEELRELAEAIREEAEGKRATTFETNEAARQQTFDTNEALRQENENGRIAAEAERAEAENLREEQEAARQQTFEANEAARQAEAERTEAARQATFEANEAARQELSDATIAEAEAATTAARTATNAANNATAATNAAISNAEAATEAADEATEAANQATESATEAAERANDSADLADTATANANTATTAAIQATEATLQAFGVLVPTALDVQYPKALTLGNPVSNYIIPTLSPESALPNVIYLSDKQSVDVEPNGKITPIKVGVSRIHVIPTLNTSLAKTITIGITTGLRMTTKTAMRILGSGNLRLT